MILTRSTSDKIFTNHCHCDYMKIGEISHSFLKKNAPQETILSHFVAVKRYSFRQMMFNHV